MSSSLLAGEKTLVECNGGASTDCENKQRPKAKKMLRAEEMMEGMHEMPYYVTKTTRYPQRNKRRYSDPQYYTGADLTTGVQYY